MIASVVCAPLAFGVDAPPAAIPVDIVFSIDSSGSMGPPPPKSTWPAIAQRIGMPEEEIPRLFGKDIERRRVQAVTAALDKLKEQAGIYQVGLVSWDNDIDFSLPLTANFDAIRAKLQDVDSAGGTNLKLGLSEALNLLQRSPRSDAKRVVVFLTDGMANEPAAIIDDAVLERARTLKVTVYTIGLDVPEPATAILQKTADTTGGRYFPAPDAARLQTIFEEILEQVADVFLDLRIPAASVSASSGQSVSVSVYLADSTGRTPVAAQDLRVAFNAIRRRVPQEGDPEEQQFPPQELSLRRGSGFVSTSITGLDTPGLLSVQARVIDYLGLSNRTMLVLERSTGPPPTERVRFELFMDQLSVPVGNPIHVRAVALDEAGNPVPVAQDYPLVFHLRPLELQRAEIQQPVRGAMGPRGPAFTPSAWAQPATASRDVMKGEFLTLRRGIIDLKGRIHQGESIFYFSIASVDLWGFSISLEVPLIGSIGKELLGAFADSSPPEGFDIWARKTELLANSKDKTHMYLILVARRGDKGTEVVPTCGNKQEYEIALTTSLGSLPESSMKVPDARCHAIIPWEPVLQAGSWSGNAIVQAKIRNPDLFGLRSIKFLPLLSGWHLLFAALGGCLGVLLAESRKLAGVLRDWTKYVDVVGPFLVMGMAVGSALYLALYYGAYKLSIPFSPVSPYVGFAVTVIGAVAGYFGAGIMGKLIARFGLKRTGNT